MAYVQPAPASLHRTTVRVALVVLAIVAVLAVAELTPERFNAFTRDHSLISTFMTEAILLVGVYLAVPHPRHCGHIGSGRRVLTRRLSRLGAREILPAALPWRLSLMSARQCSSSE